MAARSLGKIPTTFDRRLTSLLSRSSGLFDQILRQCDLGNVANARTSVRAVAMDSAALGNRSARVVSTSSQRASISALSDRAKIDRKAAATNSTWDFGTVASRLRA